MTKSKIIKAEDILKDPENTPLPTNDIAIVATNSNMSSYFEKNQKFEVYDAFMTYAMRYPSIVWTVALGLDLTRVIEKNHEFIDFAFNNPENCKRMEFFGAYVSRTVFDAIED